MTLMPVPDTLLGGALIGAATSLLYLGIGRIAGISGITFGLIGNSDRAWRAVFLAGLIGGYRLAQPQPDYPLRDPAVASHVAALAPTRQCVALNCSSDIV